MSWSGLQAAGRFKSARLGVIGLFLLAGCASPDTQPQGAPTGFAEDFRGTVEAIERRTGGRLGMALRDDQGGLIWSYRGQERFALCSTFKTLLSGMVLSGLATDAEEQAALYFDEDDLLDWAPFAQEQLPSGAMSVEEAAHYAVMLSDNTAANLLLHKIGGPGEFTAWLRSAGDEATRLDRFEPELNANSVGDLRDTTEPEAISLSYHALLLGDLVDDNTRERLREWMAQSPQGADRLRAGLPNSWPKGSKAGTCASETTGTNGASVNDVAWFRTESGKNYILAVYVDRPTQRRTDVEDLMAELSGDVARRLEAAP